MDACRENSRITIPELAAILGITKRSVERNIQSLREKGLLRRVGGRKEGRWESSNDTTKLIEVALPLPEINDASAYDKMPGIGPHPKGIHQWWARLPLLAARAMLLNKCNLELVPRWLDRPLVNPEVQDNDLRNNEWPRAAGLAGEGHGASASGHGEDHPRCNRKLPYPQI